MTNKSPYFGEAIQSGSLLWEIATWESTKYPPLGACIIVEQNEHKLCACISNITTGSSEAQRSPQPLQKSAEELARDYPHIYSFLQTNITVTPLGYIHQQICYHQPSPEIPQIHAFARAATTEELIILFDQGTTFNLLFCAHQPPFLDTLIGVVVMQYASRCGLPRTKAIQFARNFARLCANDTIRVQAFIQLLERIISQDPHV